MARTLVCNGTIVDPSQGWHDRLDLLVEDGRVRVVGRALPREGIDRVIEARGLVVAPGFVDLRAHLGEPGREGAETIATATRAAAAGGFTTVLAAPNTNPVCDTHTGVHYVISRAANLGVVRVRPVAAITRGHEGKELVEFGLLKEAGALAFCDGERSLMNADLMRRALEYTRMLGVPLMEHCEDLHLAGVGTMHEGEVSLRLGLRGIPRVAESIIVARDVALAAMTGGHVHICHVSTRESVEAIREAKRSGIRVTAEVTPHHLTLTDEAVLNYNTNAKVRPPLAAETDRRALVAALEDGTIDCIATDHMPHGATSKNSVFDAAPFGIIGFETAFAVLYTEFVATRQWTLDFLIERLTSAPARVVAQPWGTLAPDAPADFTLIDPTADYVLEPGMLSSKSRNSPWLGRRLESRVVATFVGGEPAYLDPASFPQGEFKPASASDPEPPPAKSKRRRASSRK